MSRYLTRVTLVRLLIIVATVALTWGALMIGQQTAAVTVTVGEPSPQDFFADQFVKVVDPVATAEAKSAAAEKIEPVYSPDPERSQEVLVGIGQLFDTVAAAVFLPAPEPVPSTTTTVTEPEVTTTASTTTPTPPAGDESPPTTTPAPAPTHVTRLVLLPPPRSVLLDPQAGPSP